VRTNLVWEALAWPGLEHVAWSCDGDARSGGLIAESVALIALPDESPDEPPDAAAAGAHPGEPVRIAYRIRADRRGRTRAVEIESGRGSNARRLSLHSDGAGHWCDAAGQPLSHLDGCVDVDITLTPFTNTLPIRRLRLAPGCAGDIRAAYVNIADLTVTAADQRYTRLDAEGRYRYESGTFRTDLVVDGDGVVVDYPGLWRRVRTA
jgi:hypothetical protein